MGLVLQTQRRGIEELHKHAEPLPHLDITTPLVLPDGTPLHILGVSNGVGSCSDIHDMDVLVVGTRPRVDGPPRFPYGSSATTCSYMVLLDEHDPDHTPHGPWHNTLELLRVTLDGARFLCEPTGHKSRYVVIV